MKSCTQPENELQSQRAASCSTRDTTTHTAFLHSDTRGSTTHTSGAGTWQKTMKKIRKSAKDISARRPTRNWRSFCCRSPLSNPAGTAMALLLAYSRPDLSSVASPIAGLSPLQLAHPLIQKILGVIYGNCLGDAFGLATEFLDREGFKHMYGNTYEPETREGGANRRKKEKIEHVSQETH